MDLLTQDAVVDEVSAPPELFPSPGPSLDWLAWRTSFGFGRFEAIVLALYMATVAVGLYFHELWGDEAQAWLIARDNTFWQIFRHRLHYEGTPPLWPFFLHALHLAHVPYQAIGACASIFAIAGMYVMLRYSPFPILIRALIPFTFFFIYQYAVVARSYVLFPLLVFSLCVLYSSARPRILPFAITASLLANLCMQGMVFATIFTMLYAWEIYRQRVRMPRAYRATFARTYLLPLAVLASALIIAVYAALPAPDVNFAVRDQVSDGVTHKLLVELVGETPHIESHPRPETNPWLISAARADDLVDPNRSNPPYRKLTPPEPSWRHAFGDWLGWQVTIDPRQRSIGESTASIIYSLTEFASPLFYGLSNFNALNAAFIAALLLWAFLIRGLRFFLPFLVLLLVGEFLWVADHHTGLLLVVLLAGIWLAVAHANPRPNLARVEPASLLCLSAVLIVQVLWSVSAIDKEIHRSYDPGSATAAYLQHQPAGATIAAFHWSTVSTQPYFPTNPFFNVSTSWWQWNRYADSDASSHRALALRPDVVVFSQERRLPDEMRNQILPLNPVSDFDTRDPILTDIKLHGYRETHRFCGQRFSRFDAALQVCNIIFERPELTQLTSTAPPANDPKSESHSR